MGASTGCPNVVADVLSRNPVGILDGSQISCAALRALALNSREQLIREQREYPELEHICRYLENPDDGSVNATVCEAPTSHPDPKDGFLLVITDYFTQWSELIPLRKASAEAIINALFENYISRYGAPISLISDNGPQFISEVFEHLSHRMDIKHMKTVTYRPQANLTERVNRNLVQMIACFVENHENWDRFLHVFAFALPTSVNETTNKTPA
ncbi:retrovirus-related Pol polyprotein from transposon 17.6 [Trichonephila clavipes]|uniref:Retrovirus-related Pol polyprotein from transposon 17.6 n=1 Tax=Trichonephila clavipes TaxID=2585209 RepID=A0A8X6VDE1_TRICX|nr:retrovirus-related Pol polyprotein from transposon 17.6 [Trichonephila clavipes]